MQIIQNFCDGCKKSITRFTEISVDTERECPTVLHPTRFMGQLYSDGVQWFPPTKYALCRDCYKKVELLINPQSGEASV